MPGTLFGGIREEMDDRENAGTAFNCIPRGEARELSSGIMPRGSNEAEAMDRSH